MVKVLGETFSIKEKQNKGTRYTFQKFLQIQSVLDFLFIFLGLETSHQRKVKTKANK
jgi:hypothetical protein